MKATIARYFSALTRLESRTFYAISLLSKDVRVTPDYPRQVRYDEPEVKSARVRFVFIDDDDIGAIRDGWRKRTRGLVEDATLNVDNHRFDIGRFR